MKCLSIAIAIALVLAPSLAHAGKPTAKEAKAALAAWNAELHKVDSTKAADLAGAPAATSTPFQVAVFFSDGAGDKTCESTVTDKAKLGDALLCVKQYAQIMPTKAWSSKWLKKLPGQLSSYKDTIAALAKTGVLFVHSAEGEDVSEFGIVALVKDADGVVRVAAVFSYYFTT